MLRVVAFVAVILVFIYFGGLVLLTVFLPTGAFARNSGQWAQLGAVNPGNGDWFTRQRQPDLPESSCCGYADAYWADQAETVFDAEGNPHVFAIITDDRDDVELNRPHLDIGTRIEVPPHKVKDTRNDPNPTGHTIIFVGGPTVFCYIPNGGV
jgi:hypothetical protein